MYNPTLFNLFCSFQVSRALANRGFINYLSGKDISIEQWYDDFGNIISRPTIYPIARYSHIFRWLFENDLYILVSPEEDTSKYRGRVFKPTGSSDEEGRPLMRLREDSCSELTFEDAYLSAIRRAIQVMPLVPIDDDLPF